MINLPSNISHLSSISWGASYSPLMQTGVLKQNLFECAPAALRTFSPANQASGVWLSQFKQPDRPVDDGDHEPGLGGGPRQDTEIDRIPNEPDEGCGWREERGGGDSIDWDGGDGDYLFTGMQMNTSYQMPWFALKYYLAQQNRF